MYILIIARGYPLEENSLRGIFEFDQAKALRDFGHKVVFLSLDLRSVRRKRKLGLYQTRVEGVDIVNISFPVGNVPAWLFVTIGRIVIEQAYKFVQKKHGQPDIMHSHFSATSAIAAFLSKKHKIKLIVTEHSSLVNTGKLSAKTKYYCQIAYKHAEKIIVVSAALAKQIKKHFNVEVEIVQNVVDVKNFHYQKQKKHKGFHFISVGSLKPIKGFDTLIEGFYAANQNHFSLTIVGDGPEKTKLQSQIDRLNLGNKIRLAGQLPRDEISILMQKSDAFVLASKSETFGVAFIEAMAAGLPVISTRCGGPEDFVNQTNGLFVEVDNRNHLAQEMIRLYENYHMYDRELISSTSRKLFEPKVIAQKLTMLYNRVLGKHAGQVSLISVCRLLPLKNLRAVITAIVEGRLEANYTIVGDGPDRENLEALIKKHQLEERVKLSGHLPHHRVKEILGSFDLFVMPSYPETLGRVYFEAMAAGLPVVAARGTGVDGLIEHEKHGYLVDHQNPTELMSVLKTFILKPPNERLQMKQHALLLAKQFTWNSILQKHQRFYHE